MQAKVGALSSGHDRNRTDFRQGIPKGVDAGAWRQFETSTVVSTGSAPLRIRISRTG